MWNHSNLCREMTHMTQFNIWDTTDFIIWTCERNKPQKQQSEYVMLQKRSRQQFNISVWLIASCFRRFSRMNTAFISSWNFKQKTIQRFLTCGLIKRVKEAAVIGFNTNSMKGGWVDDELHHIRPSCSLSGWCVKFKHPLRCVKGFTSYHIGMFSEGDGGAILRVLHASPMDGPK